VNGQDPYRAAAQYSQTRRDREEPDDSYREAAMASRGPKPEITGEDLRAPSDVTRTGREVPPVSEQPMAVSAILQGAEPRQTPRPTRELKPQERGWLAEAVRYSGPTGDEADEAARRLENPVFNVMRALGRDAGARFVLQGAQKFIDWAGAPVGVETHDYVRRIVNLANRQREAEKAGKPLLAAELTRGLTEFIAEIGLIPGAGTPSQVARFGPRVMAEVGTAERTVAAPVLRALGRAPERVVGAATERLPGTVGSRIARRAAEDAARFGGVETLVGAAQEPTLEEAAARGRTAAAVGAAVGGGLQAGGEATSALLRRAAMRQAAQNLPPEARPTQPAPGTPRQLPPAPRAEPTVGAQDAEAITRASGNVARAMNEVAQETVATPEAVAPAAPQATPAAPHLPPTFRETELPAAPPGMVRLYRGQKPGEPGNWWTDDYQHALNYAMPRSGEVVSTVVSQEVANEHLVFEPEHGAKANEYRLPADAVGEISVARTGPQAQATPALLEPGPTEATDTMTPTPGRIVSLRKAEGAETRERLNLNRVRSGGCKEPPSTDSR